MQWVLDSLSDMVQKLDKIIDFGLEVQRRIGGGDFYLIIDDLTIAKEKIESAVDAGARGHGFQHKDHTRLPAWVKSDLKKKHHKRHQKRVLTQNRGLLY